MKTASSAIAWELCKHYDGEEILHKHATISEFREQAGESERGYFSFAGVRNPLDVLVSRFVFRRDGRNSGEDHLEQQRFIWAHGGDFNEYFFEYLVRRQPRKLALAIVPNDWNSEAFASIDYIYRYETLQEDFAAILSRLNITQVRELLPLGNPTAGKGDYLDYYENWSLIVASKLFADYLLRFEYEPQELGATVTENYDQMEEIAGLLDSLCTEWEQAPFHMRIRGAYLRELRERIRKIAGQLRKAPLE
jgi:hypothetical protein